MKPIMELGAPAQEADVGFTHEGVVQRNAVTAGLNEHMPLFYAADHCHRSIFTLQKNDTQEISDGNEMRESGGADTFCTA